MTPNPKKWFIDQYIKHLRNRAARHADEVRGMQAEASRVDEQAIRLDVFSDDVRQRGLIQQDVFSYCVRVRDGVVEDLPLDTRHDVRVLTDVNTMWGFANNRLGMTLPDGSTRTVTPFTPRDAVRMGLLETDGKASALKNLYLLERTILPRLADELKLPKPPAS